MKKTIKNILIPALLLVIAIFSGCEKKEVSSNKSIGYIMDYFMCSGYIVDNDSAQAVAYYIITENLKDTLRTHTVPNNISKFPLDFFENTENYRYSYKIEFEYEYEYLDTTIVCTTLYPDLSFMYPNAKVVNITSARTINSK